MRAADVMSRWVTAVHPDTPVVEAVRLMLQDEVSGLPVVDHAGRLVGIVSEGDFLRRSERGAERKRRRWIEFLIGQERLAGEYAHAHSKRVADVMRFPVVTVGPDASLDEILETMERHHIKRVPVVQDGRVVGIVSRANLLRAFASINAAPQASARSIASDRAIQAHILAELDAQPWAPSTSIEVVVWDGSVHLWGWITDEAQRRALRVLAESAPRVSDVTDHLALIERMPGFIL